MGKTWSLRPSTVLQSYGPFNRAIFDLARPYLILQGQIRSRKAKFDLARPNSISQGHIWSRKAISDLAKPYPISQGRIRSRNAIDDLSTFRDLGMVIVTTGWMFALPLCSSNRPFISYSTLQMRGELNTHNLIHTNAKNFICTECGLGFRTKMAMDSHTLRKHTNLKPRFGFCVLNFLSNLSDFLSREKLTQKWLAPKLSNLQNFDIWMIKLTKTTNCQIFLYKFTSYSQLLSFWLYLFLCQFLSWEIIWEVWEKI